MAAARKSATRKSATRPAKPPSHTPSPTRDDPPAPQPAWEPAQAPAPGWQPATAQASAAPPAAAAMDDRQYTLLLHLSALAGVIVGFFFLGPLILWLVRKDQSSFVDRHGRGAVDFHLSMLLYGFGGFLLYMVLAIATFGLGGLLLLPLLLVGALALVVLSIVFPIIAGAKANQGHEYRYPLAIRFLRRGPSGLP